MLRSGEVMRLLNLSRQQLHYHIKTGKLSKYKVDGYIMFDDAEVNRLKSQLESMHGEKREASYIENLKQSYINAQCAQKKLVSKTDLTNDDINKLQKLNQVKSLINELLNMGE